ncbi:MAG: hypothetical protein HYS98_08755 [Deltaproteobacteria bacterium]|nr:hypothetical protein [Deltaproteobacteria bacterium]
MKKSLIKNLIELPLPYKYLKEGLLLLKTELDSAPYLEQSFEEFLCLEVRP